MSDAGAPAAYDRRAAEYVQVLGSVGQLAPHDRVTIESWGAAVRGPVLDAGCGPGHWSDHLARRVGRDVVGLDGSARFVASARRRFRHVPVLRGDLAQLPFADASLGGVLAWYSVIHTPPSDLDAILGEFARVLVSGGTLLLGFVAGTPGTPFDHAVTTAYYLSGAGLAALLAPHGLVVGRVATRHDVGARPHGELVAVRA